MAWRGLPVKTAIVHEWLTTYAGSEKVVEGFLDLFPTAPIFTLVHQPQNFVGTVFEGRDVRTSFIQNLPLGARKYQSYLPLMPLAVEQFDLSGFELILSSNHAVAKGVRAPAGALHVSYVHTPVRYAWDLQDPYLKEAGLETGAKGALARAALHYLRLWDHGTAHRADVFLANSAYVARRVWRAYRRPARVLYPPVDVERFDWERPREDFYFTFSRMVPYKKLDLIVEAFTRLDKPLIVLGDGPEHEKIAALAGPNVTLLRGNDAVVADLLARCKALVFAADEDFGIVPVEAQAAGAPVIAYGHGGVLESVVAGETGVLYEEQSVDSLVRAVERFEALSPFDAAAIRRNAERFSKRRFWQGLDEVLDLSWSAFKSGRDPETVLFPKP